MSTVPVPPSPLKTLHAQDLAPDGCRHDCSVYVRVHVCVCVCVFVCVCVCVCA